MVLLNFFYVVLLNLFFSFFLLRQSECLPCGRPTGQISKAVGPGMAWIVGLTMWASCDSGRISENFGVLVCSCAVVVRPGESHDEQTKRAGAAFTPGRRRMALSPMVCACLRHALLVRKILPRSLKRQTSANVCKCARKMAQPCATLNAQNGSNCAIFVVPSRKLFGFNL